jgi:glutathione S-transferase
MMRLIFGNKNYSSWSLRAWLPLKHCGIAFEDERIALFEPGYKERIQRHSPAGKVPVLIDGSTIVWESLAIGEYLAETFPTLGLWPADAGARAHARAISAEMHAGFPNLRSAMPMNIRASHPGKGRSPEVDADIARVVAIWNECLQRSGGPFLFGAFTLADAMYAPVATRFLTYAVPLDARARGYVEHLWNLPAMLQWRADAVAETEFIDEDEPYR